MASVLFVGVGGQDPNISLPPNVTSQELDAAIKKGVADMKGAGYRVTALLPPIMEGIASLESELQNNKYDLVLVSLGIRIVPQHTPYFEGVINTVLKYSPGQRFAFNEDLKSMLSAAQRALPL